MNSRRFLPPVLCFALAGGAQIAFASSSSLGTAGEQDQVQEKQDKEKGGQVLDTQGELAQLHNQFRRQVEIAFRRASSGLPDEKNDADRAGDREDQDRPPARVGQDQEPKSMKDLSYDTSQLLITSLDPGVLLAGAPVRDTAVGRVGGNDDDRSRSSDQDGGNGPSTANRNEHAVGGIMISGPVTPSVQKSERDGDQGQDTGRRADQPSEKGTRSQPLAAGFYVVRLTERNEVELVDTRGRVQRSIPLEEAREENAGDVGVRSASTKPEAEWDRVYGRILGWIAPYLETK